MNKYEQLLEHIINDESEKASELFHTIVVEQSRDIYESLIDEEDLAEVGGNEVEELAHEVMADEEGISEEEFSDEESDFDAEEVGAEDEFGGEEELDGEESVEDRVVDLETALDDLKAEFDALMADEAGEEEHADLDFDSEELDGEEVFGDEEAEEEFDGEMVREYVEKVAAPSKTEGGEVGKGGTATVNKQSIVAKKNDMGGTASNIVKGGTENSKSAKKPQDMNSGNINVPGGKAGGAFKTKEAPKASEGETTDGKVSVDNKSLVGSKKVR